MSEGIRPVAGTGGFPRAIADLADLTRRPAFGLPLSAALQFATTAYSYSQVDGEPTGALLQLWGASATLLISFSFTWRGVTPTLNRLFLGNLLLQLVSFELGVLVTGHSPAAGLWVFLANVVQAAIVAVVFRAVHRHDDWAPRTATDLGVILLASVLANAVTTPMGAWPGFGLDQLTSELTLWWLIRGSADLAMGSIPVLLVCHSHAGGHLKVPWPWFQWLLIPALYGANRVVFHWPTLPLAWLVILCALWAGLALTPRLAGLFALASSGMTAWVGILEGRPWHAADSIGSGVVVDLLSLICVYLAILLPLVRAQRARMQARVAAQGALLNTVFDVMADGVLVFEPDGRVALANDRAAELLGRPLAGRAPGSWKDYFDIREVEGVPLPSQAETVEQVMASAEAREFDIAVPAAGETRRYLRLNVRQFGNADRRVVVVVSDITERRLRQQELMKFAGRVAHDLRNPMTSAQLWLETVQESLAAGQQSMAESSAIRADQALQRLNQVVDGWLVYSISRDGALEETTCRLDVMARNLIAALAPAEDGTVPEFTIDARHPVLADETLVRELLANLIGNALKYGVPGKAPRIALTTRPKGAMIEVSVRDHGQGIRAGDEEDIFEEFHRGVDVPDNVRGSGMGLATCKMIVTRHGGTIRAERMADEGTRIVFTLPAA